MGFGNYLSGYLPMLRLGDFNFSINVAVFQEMRRSTEYKWPGQDRVGQRPALQFTGLGEDTITLPGVIYPEWRGSANAMATVRKIAGQGKPLLLLDAQGHIYGRWVITNVEETRSMFGAFTMPRKIEFSITIQHFDGEETNTLADFVGGLISQALQ